MRSIRVIFCTLDNICAPWYIWLWYHSTQQTTDYKYRDVRFRDLSREPCTTVQVTQLDRDPSSGTAIQEISFWLNLERALRNIQEKCDSVEVTLTLEVLRLGRRFHVTVKFDTDTGEHVVFQYTVELFKFRACCLYIREGMFVWRLLVISTHPVTSI